jgi:5,10-methylene-tetrahydrofolate dehydrogenase/methenyl tetrahydrofolate cyclohydrolase
MTTQKPQDPKRIDGNAYASIFKNEVKEEINKMIKEGLTVPGIGVVLVGDRKDSTTYVSMKQKAANEVGMHFELKQLADTVPEEKVLEAGIYHHFSLVIDFNIFNLLLFNQMQSKSAEE